MSVLSLFAVFHEIHELTAMQMLRIHRPRVVIHGPVGMGQAYVGAAALHHLEGYHIQSLELGTLLSDSTRVRERVYQRFLKLIFL